MPEYWKEEPVRWLSLGFELEFDTPFGAYIDDIQGLLTREYGGDRVRVFNYNHRSTGETWDIKTDGSAGRAGTHGWEIASPVFSPDQLYDFLEAIRIINAFTSDSHLWQGCGFHVHFGLANVDGKVAQQFLAFMVYFQLAFLTFMPVSRSNNRFARANDYEELLSSFHSHVSRARKNASTERYRLVNLTRYHKDERFRVEFRHHSGTREPEKVYLWFRTLMACLRASMSWAPPGKGDGYYVELYDLIARVDPYAARWTRERREAFMRTNRNHGFIDDLPGIERDSVSFDRMSHEDIMLVTLLGKGGTCSATDMNRKVDEVTDRSCRHGYLSIMRQRMIQSGLMERLGNSNRYRITPAGQARAALLCKKREIVTEQASLWGPEPQFNDNEVPF
jgi:hypothetical protein